MKIVANRKSLLSALTLAAQAVPTRLIKEVLANVLITADPNRCTLYGTDCDVVVKAEFQAEVNSPGSVLAPARLLHSILREAPDDSILLEVNKQTLKVRGQSLKHDIPTAKTDEFPELPAPKWITTVEVPAAMFTSCLKAVSPQADDAHAGYALECIRLEIGGKKLSLIATDGRVLCAAEIDVDSEAEAGVLVSRRASRLLCNLESESPVRLSIESNWMSVEAGDCQVMARLSEGRFVRWRDVIHRNHRPKFSASIVPSQMASCIRQACVAAPDESVGPRASLIIGNGDLTLRHSVGGNDSESRMPCASDGNLDSLYNWKFLLEVLSAFAVFGDEPVNIQSNGDEEAMLFSRDHLTCLVLPRAKDAK